MTSDRDLLDAYRATIWTVRLPDGERRFRLCREAPGLVPELPGAVVTAYNPGSSLATATANERANDGLRRELEAAGARLHHAVAAGTGENAALWTEPGFYVRGLSQDEIVRAGRRWRQNAIVWIGPDSIPTLLVTRPGFCGASVGEPL